MNINPLHNTIASPNGLDIYYTGPDRQDGPLPAFFYFALTGPESLDLEPFCEPVSFLRGKGCRCFSFTLPFHQLDQSANDSMMAWYHAIVEGNDFFAPFFEKAVENIQLLITEGLVDPDKIAVGGLSRGGFIAVHLAARIPSIQTIVGFAPLTQLILSADTGERSALAESYALRHQVKNLAGKSLRFYVGNRDMRVGTKNCFDFTQQLTEANYESGSRSPPVELVISPSIGHKGHGTSKEIFDVGAAWVASLF